MKLVKNTYPCWSRQTEWSAPTAKPRTGCNVSQRFLFCDVTVGNFVPFHSTTAATYNFFSGLFSFLLPSAILNQLSAAAARSVILTRHASA